jgi:hypothetical protein
MPAAGARFAIAHFNLPVIGLPRPHGIFVVFLVDADTIVTSTQPPQNIGQLIYEYIDRKKVLYFLC